MGEESDKSIFRDVFLAGSLDKKSCDDEYKKKPLHSNLDINMLQANQQISVELVQPD
jgi:hypothetical protein